MFDFQKISASKFYEAPSVERVVEFSPQDIDMSNVAKVLSLAVDAKSTSIDSQNGFAQLSGRCNFRLIYLDKEGSARGVDYNADFSVRIDGEFADGDNVSADIAVLEADVEASQTLTLTAVLEIKVCAIKREELQMLKSAQDCYTTTKEVYVPSFIATKTATVSFDDEKDVGGEVDAVLGLNVACVPTKSVATDGGANTAFSVLATVTYVEGGEIKQQNFAVETDDDFALDGVLPTDSIRASACVKSSKVVLQGVTDDNVIRVEGEIQISIQAFRCSQTEIVSDLFVLSHEVDVSREVARYECFDGCGYYTQSVSGRAVLGDNKPSAISVCALPYSRCYTSRCYVSEDNMLVIEGIVNTDIIYTDENGYNSIRAEIPFSVSVGSEIPFSNVVKANCAVSNINATVVRGREFDITMDIAIKACGFSSLEAEYIGDVTLGDEREVNKSALSVYVTANGEQMLDVCKALSAMPDEIAMQNPDITFPTKEGDKIVFFRALK